MRLLIPQVDKLRPAYGMKEVNNTHAHTCTIHSIAIHDTYVICNCFIINVYVYYTYIPVRIWFMLMADCVGEVLH